VLVNTGIISTVGVRYAVLGPLEVTIDRQPTALPAAKHRIVLATLLLSANRPVSVDELAERLWGEEPPASAKATLQGYVLRLRRTLTAAGVDPVRTRPPGYLIEVGPAELDLDRFKALVAEAESAPAAVAADRLREALDLWRGPALSDVPSPSLHFAAGRWLAELRINALERRIDADLRLGRHADLLGELAGLVADSPLHEPFRAQLMLALHRAGRSADALETYRDARATFVAELGIEPGERLREVERGVLVGDPALDWRPEAPVPSSAVSRPQALPPDVPDLVGRASLADDLVARLAAPSAHSGTPVVQVIAGMSGVGKSALAVHIGHRLRPHFTDGRLHATLRDATGPLHPAEVLGRLLRQLGVLGTHLPDSVEGRSTLLRDRLAGRRVLLVLDDAVDEAQVRPLIPGDECSAVLVTSRNRLTGLAGARTVDLTVLDDGDSLRLLETVLGVDRVAAEPVAARDLIRHCGGLPLALRIAAARLAARANRPLSWLVAQLADEQRRLDGLEAGDMQVRASLATGYRALDGERQRALRLLASVNNADYSPRLAAAVLDRPPHRAERLVEDLVDAQLLELVADRYRMHGLVRVYAREQAMSDRERDAAVERALSAWLAAAEEAEAMLPNAGWLPHLSGRGSASSVDPMAWFEVERQELAVAIDQAAAEGHVGHAWRLAAACEGFLEVRGHWDDWRRCQERALVAAVVGGDRWGEARMRYGLGRLCFAQDRHELAERLLRQALELWRGDRLSQAHALMAVGDVHHHNGRLDLARACFEEAAAGYAAEHDERGTVNAGFCLGLLSRDLGDVDAAKSALAAALTAFRGLGDSYGQAQVLLFLGASHCKWGDQDAAERCLTEATALYRGFGDRLGELRSLRQLGHALVMRGETARAERVLTGCQRAFAEIGDVFGEAFTGWSLAELALRDGDERLGRHRLTVALELFTRAGLEPWQRRMRRRLAELGRSAAL
jgi:DNA-binding SARP family transcriptional activator/tetratricopeptide (TPR) repeat protein